MPNRSDLIAKAASLPVGNPERRGILHKLATNYSGDPNVSLESILYNAEKEFVEDVVKRIIRYSGLKTPVKGKPGGTHMRGDVAMGSLVNRTDLDEFGLGVEVKVRGGKILVEMSDLEGRNEKTWKFPTHSTPASIGVDVGWYGEALLMGDAHR